MKHALIEFDSVESAQTALELNGQMVSNCPLSICSANVAVQHGSPTERGTSSFDFSEKCEPLTDAKAIAHNSDSKLNSSTAHEDEATSNVNEKEVETNEHDDNHVVMRESESKGKEKENRSRSRSQEERKTKHRNEKKKRSRSRSHSHSRSRSRSRSPKKSRRNKRQSHSRKNRRSRSRSNSYNRHRHRRHHDHSYRNRYHDRRSLSRSLSRCHSNNSKSPPNANDPNKKTVEKEKKKPDRIWNGFAWISVEPNKNQGPSDPSALNENEIARKRCETVLAANHRALGQALAVAQLASNLNPLSLIHGNSLVTNALLGRGVNSPGGHTGGGFGASGMGGTSFNQQTPDNAAFVMAYNAANSAIQQQLNKWIPGDSSTDKSGSFRT